MRIGRAGGPTGGAAAVSFLGGFGGVGEGDFVCWRERITICCFLAMPIHDRLVGTSGVFRCGQIDLGRWRKWSFTRGKAVALNRGNWGVQSQRQ